MLHGKFHIIKLLVVLSLLSRMNMRSSRSCDLYLLRYIKFHSHNPLMLPMIFGFDWEDDVAKH